MKFSSKLAVFLITVSLLTLASTKPGHAQSLNLEVDGTTNPWVANNGIYCTGSNSTCNPKQFYKRPEEKSLPAKPVTQSTYTKPSTQQIPESPEYKSELDAAKLFVLINEYRTQNNLSSFQEDERICSVAAERAPELYNEILGDSWMHKGFYDRNLPYWATENIIYEFSEEKALNWWKNSSIHNKALLGDYQYSCVRCQGNTCSQIFTNFQEKIAISSN